MGNKIANLATGAICTFVAIIVYDIAAQTETGKKIIGNVKSIPNKAKTKCKKMKESWS